MPSLDVQDPQLLPLLIGVTGHRDVRPEDREALEQRVQTIFAEIRRQCPHTPLVLLSPLAEGADRLVARVALQAGLGLHAPLPLAKAVYLEDFTTAESKAEFEKLLAQAQLWFEMPAQLERDAAAGARDSSPGVAAGGDRARQYDAVGLYVARHCQILIALWDGKLSDKPGGTAQIVDWRLTKLPLSTASQLHAPDPVRTGPVYHIVTPRQGAELPGNALTTIKLFPQGLQHDTVPESTYQRMYGRIDALNADVLRLAPRLKEVHRRSLESLTPQANAEHLPQPLKINRAVFASADSLAIAYQRSTLRMLLWIFVLVFLAVSSYELYSHFLHEELQASLFVYPLFVGCAYGVYLWASRHDLQNRYQDYRVLAEGLRVQFFWRLSGVTAAVEENYLRKHRSELDWIRCALRVIWSLQGGELAHVSGPASMEHHQDRVGQTLDRWVGDQHAFFARRAAGEEHFHHRLELVVTYSIWLGLGLAVVLGLLLVVPNPLGAALSHWFEEFPMMESGFILMTGLPLVTANLVHSYVEARTLTTHARQYRAMEKLFSNGQGRLAALAGAGRDRLQECRALIEELGKEALAENGEWVVMHRDKPLEVPHGR